MNFPATHFSHETLRRLAALGITVTGLQAIPGGDDAYKLNDNGTQRLRTFREVLALADPLDGDIILADTFVERPDTRTFHPIKTGVRG
jgi:hypothetical protein